MYPPRYAGAAAESGYSPSSLRRSSAATSPPSGTVRTPLGAGSRRGALHQRRGWASRPAAARFDVVIDTVGGAVLDGSYGLLRQGGWLVTLGAPPDQELPGRYKVHFSFSSRIRAS